MLAAHRKKNNRARRSNYTFALLGTGTKSCPFPVKNAAHFFYKKPLGISYNFLIFACFLKIIKVIENE